jgi:molybdate transport repressor ModE-like protein
MNFTLRQVRYFVAVAESGSISGAARQLSVSQSAITEAVKELESDLGSDLLRRTGRGVTLTHKGHQFLRHAGRILGAVADAGRTLAEDATPGGELHLGASSLVAGYVLADLLARFRRAFPSVLVEAVEDTAEYLEHLLVNGELDVAVMVVARLRESQALRVEVLEQSAYRLWLPLGHPLAGRETVSLADVAREKQIVLTVDEIQEAAAAFWRENGLRPEIAFRTRSVESVRSLVATGAGVAVLPDLIYRPWSLEGDRIEARPTVESLPPVRVGAVWRRGSRQSDAARMFLDVVLQRPITRGPNGG